MDAKQLVEKAKDAGCIIDETRGFDKETKEWVYYVECVRTESHDCKFDGWEMFREPQKGVK